MSNKAWEALAAMKAKFATRRNVILVIVGIIVIYLLLNHYWL